MHIISVDSQELQQLGYNEACEVPLEDIPRLMLALKRDEVIKAYCDAFGFTPEELGPDGFEGGIDDWIGFGSVTCCELGGGTFVGYGHNDIQMVVIG